MRSSNLNGNTPRVMSYIHLIKRSVWAFTRNWG